MQRYKQILNLQNFFPNIFSKNEKFSHLLTIRKLFCCLHLIIYIKSLVVDFLHGLLAFFHYIHSDNVF